MRAGAQQQQARHQDQAGGRAAPTRRDPDHAPQSQKEPGRATAQVRHQEQRHRAVQGGEEAARQGREDEGEAEEGGGADAGRGGGVGGGGGGEGVRAAPEALLGADIQLRRARPRAVQPEHGGPAEADRDVVGSGAPGGGGERGEERARGVRAAGAAVQQGADRSHGRSGGAEELGGVQPGGRGVRPHAEDDQVVQEEDRTFERVEQVAGQAGTDQLDRLK